MAKRPDGPVGPHSPFRTTCWGDIQAVRTANQSHQRIAVAALAERYWRPVYYFLRRKGYVDEQARDLTQGFFQEIVLERRLFEQADPSRGRFRTFLLTALVRYVASERRHQKAGKRHPKGGIKSLEVCPTWEENGPEAINPEQAFMYAWAADVLDRTMTEVQKEFCDSGREVYWKIFHARVVAPIAMGGEEPSLTEICRTYSVEAEKTASNMIVTVKRRFRSILRRILAEGMVCESEVEDEMGVLISILSEAGAA